MNAKCVNCKSICLVLGMAFMLLSCRHKDLCYDDVYTSDVEVVFDWSEAPEARVSSMRVFLYPDGGGNVLTYEFGNMTGGTVRIPGGSYRAICINSDTESLLFQNTQLYDGFKVRTPASLMNEVLYASLQSKFREAPMPVQAPSDNVYSDRIDLLTIEAAGRKQSVVFYPKPSFSRYRIKIVNVSNLEHAVQGSITGGLSGMSEGLFVGKNELDEDMTIVPFSMDAAESSTLTTEFFTLGHAVSDEHKVAVLVSLGDGQQECYVFDVTDQVRNAQDKRDIFIQLDGMKLPKPIYNGNGFKPSVEDWQDVNIPLDM